MFAPAESLTQHPFSSSIRLKVLCHARHIFDDFDTIGCKKFLIEIQGFRPSLLRSFIPSLKDIVTGLVA